MDSVKVDLEALVFAFEDSSIERSYFVDRDTGRIFKLLEDHHDTETEEMVWQIEVDGGNRIIQVPKLTMEEEMEEQDLFLSTLEEGELKDKVSKVLDSDPDGSKFPEFITRQREAREKWKISHKEQSRKRAEKWIESLGFETI